MMVDMKCFGIMGNDFVGRPILLGILRRYFPKTVAPTDILKHGVLLFDHLCVTDPAHIDSMTVVLDARAVGGD